MDTVTTCYGHSHHTLWAVNKSYGHSHTLWTQAHIMYSHHTLWTDTTHCGHIYHTSWTHHTSWTVTIRHGNSHLKIETERTKERQTDIQKKKKPKNQKDVSSYLQGCLQTARVAAPFSLVLPMKLFHLLLYDAWLLLLRPGWAPCVIAETLRPM